MAPGGSGSPYRSVRADLSFPGGSPLTGQSTRGSRQTVSASRSRSRNMSRLLLGRIARHSALPHDEVLLPRPPALGELPLLPAVDFPTPRRSRSAEADP